MGTDRRYKNLYFREGKWSVVPGSRPRDTMAEAIEIAKEKRIPLAFAFNDVDIFVDHGTDLALMERDYHRAIDGCIPKQIGPRPKEELTREEIAYDEFIRDRERENRRVREKVRIAERQIRRGLLEDRLRVIPPVKWKDHPQWIAWSTISDGELVREAYLFGERWARLMQHAIEQGVPLYKVALPLYKDADPPEMANALYHSVVSSLAHCWIYGDALTEWVKQP